MTTNFFLSTLLVISVLVNLGNQKHKNVAQTYAGQSKIELHETGIEKGFNSYFENLFEQVSHLKVKIRHEHEDGKWHNLFVSTFRRRPKGFSWRCCGAKLLLLVVYLSVQLVMFKHLCHHNNGHLLHRNVTDIRTVFPAEIKLFSIN
jgi:hypothetical protein